MFLEISGAILGGCCTVVRVGHLFEENNLSKTHKKAIKQTSTDTTSLFGGLVPGTSVDPCDAWSLYAASSYWSVMTITSGTECSKAAGIFEHRKLENSKHAMALFRLR